MVVHSSYEDPELRECLVESMHAYIGPPPEEAGERIRTKTMNIGKPASPEEQYEQIVSRIVAAHIGEIRYCGTVAGEGVEGSVGVEMDFDGGDLLRAATPDESELPPEVVDCIKGAVLRWKFPKAPFELVLHHTFNVPVPSIQKADED